MIEIPAQSILIDRQRLEARVKELAAAIDRDYRDKEVILLSILKGSILFLSDLMKELTLDLRIGFFYLSSYRGNTTPQNPIEQYPLPLPALQNRHVLIVEDILDSGTSIHYALEACRRYRPASLKTCILLNKVGAQRNYTIRIDYKGFDIPNVFVIGYGLDYQERYRQLPFIAVLNSSQPESSQ